MIRPKFTIANLLMLTVIVAMAALMVRNRVRVQQIEARDRVRIQHLEAQLALHDAVRAQARRVRQRELELRATLQQTLPELDIAAQYRWTGLGERLQSTVVRNSSRQRASGASTPDATTAWQSGMEIIHPIGFRRAKLKVRNSQLQLAREQAVLERLEQELSQ